MIHLQSEAQFQEAIRPDSLSVVKFFTTWCPDCKRLNTFIDDIIAKHSDLRWYEINGEDVPNLTEQYEVRGVPSLLVFRAGEKVAHLHSKYTKTPEQIEAFLQEL
ncbi:thioredoxin-like protein YdbP [Alicyclobacillus contaminans]|uniref:thioredoxin family protein n=1 Tax=Alicyclobacillus contaminans TaxID=392016 RepID=UPI0004001BB3|nr:thioredoxin family protein [Alicyclobacillus contaminans]GMA51654.1 thioredoxin-like protein YdbP [Alicyclobacillus contaminans]